MITAYFLIAFFVMGWMFGVDCIDDIRLTFWERVGVTALSLAWPYLAYLLWREGRETK